MFLLNIRLKRGCICGLFAYFVLRLKVEHAYTWRAKEKKVKNKLTDRAVGRASRKNPPNQAICNFSKRKQAERFAFFLLLLHTLESAVREPLKRRIWQRSVGRWQTRRAVLANTARCVCKFTMPRLPKSNAEKCAKTSKMPRFCKVRLPLRRKMSKRGGCNLLILNADLI